MTFPGTTRTVGAAVTAAAAVVTIAVAASSLHLLTPGGGGGGGSFNAAIFVAVPIAQGGLGNDSDATNCARLTPADTPPGGADHGCATFQKAYDLMQGGDTIKVYGQSDAGGAEVNLPCSGGDLCYPQQGIITNGHSQTGPMTTFKAASGETVRIANGFLRLCGAAASCTSGNASPVSYLTLDGINIANGGYAHLALSGGTGGNVTFKNAHIWCTACDQEGTVTYPNLTTSGGLVTVRSVTGDTLDNVDIGPGCCDTDVFKLGNSAAGASNLTNYTENNVHAHDVRDSCGSMFSADVTTYGCLGKGFTDTGSSPAPLCNPGNAGGGGNCEHPDGHEINQCTTCTFSNSSFLHIGTTGSTAGAGGYFFTVQSQSSSVPFTDVTMFNVMVGDVNGSSVIISNGSNSIFGTLSILYSTFTQALRIDNGTTYHVMATGSTANIIGNLLKGGVSTGTGGTTMCTLTDGTNPITETFDYNVRSGGTCGAHDINGTPTLVDSTTASTMDLHLSGAQSADNAGEGVFCGPGKTVAMDFDLTARFLGSACDIGADEER